MEQKGDIVEKRVSRQVVRRRALVVETHEEEKVAPQPVPQVEKKDEIKLVVAEEKITSKVGSERTIEHAPVPPQKERAQVLTSGQTALARQEAPTTEAKKEGPAEQAPAAKAKETRRRDVVLSFKDRIKGTISLDKIKEKPAAGIAGQVAPPAVDEAGEEVEAKKAAKSKHKVKAIGGDLDIDGLGRATHLTQLVRTSPLDRVFQPTALGRPKKRRIISRKNLKQTKITQKKASKRVIAVEHMISVGNLAQQLGIKAGDIIKKLMEKGEMATINQEIDKDKAALIAADYEYEVRDVGFREEEVLQEELGEEAEAEGTPRHPVVTIMGHVDHGKTSLLDAIREANVAAGEAGGITQHIGAYTISLAKGDITFLDTPGHEAFSAMRARGADVTDIVVLVVAADDGLMPQTEESIAHAKAANVPIVVAINKIDKREADAEKVKRQLSEKGLVPEDWGGDVMVHLVSAKEKKGIAELLEGILLQAEVLELKALSSGRAKGTVVEAKLDKNTGPLCTVLVQRGELAVGQYAVAGMFGGKIRAMKNWAGEDVESAKPSTAVEILGLEGLPEAGDEFHVVESERDANKLIEHRLSEKQREQVASQAPVTLEDMFSKMKAGLINELPLILKTDVQGSLEALREVVAKLGNEEVKTRLIFAAVGGITESDVRLAVSSHAVIIGFNVRPEINAIHLAKGQGIDIKLYKVIYDLVNDVKLALQGLLKPLTKENYLGRAEVRQAFAVSKVGLIAGSMVVDGLVRRGASLRLLRDNVVIHEGKVGSLKRFKDDAREVKQGFECGIGIEGHTDIKEKDVIEVFEIEQVQRVLE